MEYVKHYVDISKRISRPKLMVGITESMRRAGFGIWLDREVHGFLYGDRPNPFNDVYGF